MTFPSRLNAAAATTSSQQIPGYDASNGSSKGSSTLQPTNGGAEKADGGVSGYSADRSVAIVPPIYIDFLDVNDSTSQNLNSEARGSKSSKPADKRRAVELDYTASRIRADLEKGGMAVPEIKKKGWRSLAGCEVDMSRVELKMAKAVKDSPILFTRKEPIEYPEIASIYDSLFTATYQSYEKNDGLHWDSSTSSVTSSESGGSGMPPPALVIPPLLEDAIKNKEDLRANLEEEKTKHFSSKRKRGSPDSTKPKLEHTTMNEALEACSEAR